MPAQLFAVRALTEIESPEATHALVAVLTRRQFPQELRDPGSLAPGESRELHLEES